MAFKSIFKAFNQKETMLGYELILIVDGTLRNDDASSVVAKVQDYLTQEASASNLTCEAWGRKNLGYPINKKETGLYYVMYFTCPPDKIVEIKRKLNFEEFILKNIIFKCKDINAELEFFRNLVATPQAAANLYLETKKGA